jgi:hypothetical protein
LLVGALLVLLIGSPSMTVAVIASAGVVTAIPAAMSWRRALATSPL